MIFSKGYDWFGVENGDECRCGNDLSRTIPTDPSECEKPCSGNSTEFCGNSWRLFINSWWIFSEDDTSLSESTAEYGNGVCIQDFPESRILSHKFSDDPMTIMKCQDICTSGYYQFYGLENGTDCYCGYHVYPYEKLPDSDCNIPCPGKADENCGGKSAMNIFKVETKCEKERRKNPPGIGVYTPQCMNAGVNVGAYQWTQNWPSTGYSWCVDTDGNRLEATLTPPGTADIDCKPYYTGQCLRDNVLNGELIRRILRGPQFEEDLMTLDLCYDSCKDAFFKFAGVENGTECYCANELQVLPWFDSVRLDELESKIVPDIECGKICPGNSFETCGDKNRMKIFNVRSKCEVQRDDDLQWYIDNPHGTGRTITACTNKGEFEPQQCSLNGGCNCVDVNGNLVPDSNGENCSNFYTGQCISDDMYTKILNFQSRDESMTPALCEDTCNRINLESFYYGVENSTDCYCGNDFNDDLSPSDYYLPSQLCDLPCAGNNTQMCGGSYQMNIFSIREKPLNVD